MCDFNISHIYLYINKYLYVSISSNSQVKQHLTLYNVIHMCVHIHQYFKIFSYTFKNMSISLNVKAAT